jgi:hypothetical protein
VGDLYEGPWFGRSQYDATKQNKTNYLASGVFSFDEISQNFNLKNMISTYAKDFSWEKMT